MFHLILKHRKKIFLILPCCLLVILISFLSGNAFWSSLHAESSDRQFRTFTRRLFQTEVSANTISLHYTLRSPSDYGIADIPATYGSLSSDPVAAKASVRNVLSSLQEFDPGTLSSENALTFKILDTYLENASTGTDYLLYQEPLGPVSGIHTQLPVLLSEYSFYDTQDVETYLALLKETPAYFDSVIRFEQKKAASGLFMPDYQVDSVLETCQSFIDMGKENYLVSTFDERIASLDLLPENKKDSFRKENMKLVLMIEAMIKVVVLNVLLVKGLDVIKKIFEMASAMAGTAVMIEPPAFFTGDVDVGSVMFFWIYGLFYFLVAMACSFLILITLYSRYIKLYLLVVTFPLAMPSITGGRGIEGTAYAWMKSFLSNTFEIVIIALAIAIAGRITSGISIFTSDNAIFNACDGFAQALNSMVYMILMAVSVKGAPTFLNKTFDL